MRLQYRKVSLSVIQVDGAFLTTYSLIAIMLARFRMTVIDCLYEYEKMSHNIFGDPRLVSQRNIGIVLWPKYSATAMENAFKEVTRRRGETPNPNLDHPPQQMYKTRTGTCAMYVPSP